RVATLKMKRIDRPRFSVSFQLLFSTPQPLNHSTSQRLNFFSPGTRHFFNHFRTLFGPGRAQLRCDLVIFRLRELSPWRGSSGRFASKRGYDVKMRMVNGLAAAE